MRFGCSGFAQCAKHGYMYLVFGNLGFAIAFLTDKVALGYEQRR